MGDEEQSPLPEAGWYDDPGGVVGRRRYWDGARWTDRYTSSGSPKTAGDVDRSFPGLFKVANALHVLGWIIIVLGGLLVIGGAIAAASQDAETTRDVFGQVRQTEPEASAVFIAISGAISVFFGALFCFGASGLIRLALRVEDNSFRAAAAVEKMLDRPPA
jgi:hypothetical protein